MSEQVYTWRRLWIPRTGVLNLTDDGYLLDPGSELGKWVKSDVVPFAALTHHRCLALLGEPGMGKSFALQEARAQLEPGLQAAGDAVDYIDLRAYGSEDRLVNRLFHSSVVHQWRAGTHTLHLFMDSLDECLLRIDTLSALLVEEFKSLPLNRLTVRIACRTADWPQSLESGLRSLFGNESVGVFELAPLRKSDVAEAARVQGLGVDHFLAAVSNSRVEALAIRPVTLNFLIEKFRVSGSLPASQTQLYLDGCRLLCEETNQGRRDSLRVSALSGEERLMAAARMATVTVFGNKYAIWTGVQSAPIQPEDVSLRAMAGGTEDWDGPHTLQITEASLREALSTGLFTARAAQRFGWAHQTYAEFLASLYVLRKGLSVIQVMSLLRHPDDPTGKLVPQLHEVAAWLAAQSPEIWQQIVQSDPEVLLRSDAANVSQADRARLLETFLQSFAEGRLLESFHLRSLYSRFAYSGLAEQLKRWISDRQNSAVARNVAIDIAEACEVRELQSVLAETALDTTEDVPLRVNAAYAVTQIADPSTKARLRPLALGDAGEDPDDELKGCGLLATWPDHLTAQEFFAHLTVPKRESLVGVYRGIFLRRDIASDLKLSDLPCALAWVSTIDPRGLQADRFSELATAILLRTVPHVDNPSLTSGLALALDAYLKRHHPIPSPFLDELGHHDDGRRRLLEALVSANIDGWSIAHGRLALERDFEFIVSKVESIGAERPQWVQLLQYMVNPQNQDHLERVYLASKVVPDLNDAFAWFLQPADLGSARAATMRQEYEERQKWERPQISPKLSPTPTQRIAALLDRFENGDLDAWWILNRDMTLEDDSTHFGDELESDLTLLPGWLNATNDVRHRILSAAEQYLLRKESNTQHWWGTDKFHFPDFSAYRALRLLYHEQPDRLELLPASVWKKWVPVILSYPISTGTGNEGPHLTLCTIAYRHAPSECVDSLKSILLLESKRHSHIFSHRRLDGLWDSGIAATFLELVMDPAMKPTCMADLLDLLLDHDVEAAHAYAVSLVQNRSDRDRDRALWAGVSLANHTPDAAWSVIWPAICDDPDFGKQFCMTVASAFQSSVLVRLSEPQLRDLYLWLVQQFPYQEDPHDEGAHFVGPRESVANWRDAALRTMQHRATAAAVKALEEITSVLPQYTWLNRVLLESREMYRRLSWEPVSPAEILKLTTHNNARLVRCGDDLLAVVMESLDRLQLKLKGETPAVIDLWNTNEKYHPKDENEVSNYVKRHLESDLKRSGIVVNREVEIRRGYRTNQGQRIDLFIQAIVPGDASDSPETVSLIVEVKGSWHREIYTAMQQQLRDRYLRDSRCRHGLYLVGWFPQGIAARHRDELDGLRKQLRHQAERLSSETVRVAAYVLDCGLP